MFKEAGYIIKNDFEEAKKDERVKVLVHNKHIARRLEDLEDLITENE